MPGPLGRAPNPPPAPPAGRSPRISPITAVAILLLALASTATFVVRHFFSASPEAVRAQLKAELAALEREPDFSRQAEKLNTLVGNPDYQRHGGEPYAALVKRARDTNTLVKYLPRLERDSREQMARGNFIAAARMMDEFADNWRECDRELLQKALRGPRDDYERLGNEYVDRLRKEAKALLDMGRQDEAAKKIEDARPGFKDTVWEKQLEAAKP